MGAWVVEDQGSTRFSHLRSVEAAISLCASRADQPTSDAVLARATSRLQLS